MVMWSLRWSENNFSFKISQLAYVWIELKNVFNCVMCFLVGPVHCSRDPQALYLAKKTLILDLTVLFTHLKIILLQCFQFSVISGIQTDPLY